MADKFTIKQGDTLPAFEASLTWPDGTDVTFAGGDSVVFRMATRDRTDTIVDGSAMSFDTGSNTCQYTWQAADTAIAGVFLAEVEVTFASGGVMTWPNDGYFEVHITDEL